MRAVFLYACCGSFFIHPFSVAIAEDSGKREDAPREDGKTEAGPADPTDAPDASILGSDGGANSPAGSVCAG